MERDSRGPWPGHQLWRRHPFSSPVGKSVVGQSGSPMRAFDAARSALMAAVAEHSISSAGMLAKLVGQRVRSLLLDCPTFKIELAFLRHITRDDKSRLRQMVLDALQGVSEDWPAENGGTEITIRCSGRPLQLLHYCGHCRRAQARPSHNGAGRLRVERRKEV